jgi:precorrin-6Y C5,15-methyltransferase (decarboxylating)
MTAWLTILGLSEDGAEGLTPAGRAALERAEVVMGARRHLALLPGLAARTLEWPVPFADGIPPLLALRGQPVVMLASGDPFWFGAGSTITRHLEPGEWRALPAPSTFSQAAALLGWPLEDVTCLGLHAAPLARLVPHLFPGRRLIVLLRDGPAVGELAAMLVAQGWPETRMTVLEALGGPRRRVRHRTAAGFDLPDVTHPVAVALEPAGGTLLHSASGQPDDLFDHDGQITRRPVRAITLSALAPRPGEHLWDIGAGSGSIAIEWMLAHPACRATAIEANPARAARLRANADRLGADRLTLVQGTAPEALAGLAAPDAVFIGGGASQALLDHLWAGLPKGCRIVANAVTLESEALFAQAQADHGGTLLRIEIAEAAPLGTRRGWKGAYPLVQWTVVR